MSSSTLQIVNNGLTGTIFFGRDRSIREVVIGSTVQLITSDGVSTLTAASKPGGSTATINTGALTISVDTVGLYRFVTVFTDGSTREFFLFGVEAGAISSIAAQSPPRGTPLTATQQQLIIRSLVNEGPPASWFTGTAASLVGHSLVPFGA